MLKIYDQNRKFTGYISNYKDLCIEKDLSSGDRTASFTCCSKKTSIQTEGYIQTEEDWFVVKEIEISSDGFPEIHCQLDLEALEAYTIDNFVAENADLASAAKAAVSGTGWSVETDIQKLRSVAVIRADPLAILKKIRDAWMCEIEFDTKNKVVRFSEQIGEDKGVYLLSQLNLKKAGCTIDTYDFYTRMIPIGADGIGIADVNDGKEYVENYQYSNKIRTIVWEDTSYESAEALKEDATAKLEDLSKPKRSYTADVRDLAKMSKQYELLSFKLGDTVRIVDEATGIHDKQRIVKIKEYPQNPEQNTCELSNTTLTFEEYQAKLEAAANAFETISNKDGTVNGVYVKGIQAGDVVGIEVTINGSTAVKKLNGQVSSLEGEIQSTNAQLEQVKADNAAFETLTTGKFEAANGKIDNLEAGYGEINTLINGNLTSDNIHSLTLNSKNTTIDNGMIKNAMIESLAFDKISGVDVNTTKFTVHSEDGLSKWEDNTIQISDTKNTVRVQIGKDGSGDYTLAVWDSAGKLIWDALGATENTIQRKIIRDAVVADDAAIDGKKLDITSVVTEINGSQEKLSSTVINVDAKNQTLSAVLNTMETTMGENLDAAKAYSDGQFSEAQKYALEKANEALIGAKSYSDEQAEAAEEKITGLTEITTTHSTDIETMQGQISSLITEDTQIKGDYEALVSRYSLLEQNVGEISTTVGEHTTLIGDTEERVTAAESTILQQAESIELKVSKDDVISTINQTAETVKIDASKVELSGYVTFTNAATKGEVTIDGGNLKAGTVTADKIDVANLFAQNITATGSITGLEINCEKGKIGGWTVNAKSLTSSTPSGQYVFFGNGDNTNQDVFSVRTGEGTSASPYAWPVGIRATGEAWFGKMSISADGHVTVKDAGAADSAYLKAMNSSNQNDYTQVSSYGITVRRPELSASADYYCNEMAITNPSNNTYTMASAEGIGTSGTISAGGSITTSGGVNINGRDSGGAHVRMVYGNYGVMLWNDGVQAHLLLTNAGDQYGERRKVFPFYVDLASGSVTMGAGQSLKGGTYIYSTSGNNRMVFNSSDRLIPTAASGASSPNTVDLGSGDNYFKTLYYGTALTKKSDRRDKNDLGDLPADEALLLLSNFLAKKFTYKNDPTSAVQYGGYAQDVRDTLIETGIGYRGLLNVSIKETEETTQDLQFAEDLVTYGLDYTQYIAPLIVGWQSHNTAIEELKRRNTELDERLSKIESKINA